MTQVVYGIAFDELGHASKEVLAQGPTGLELRHKAWASPGFALRSVQPAPLRIDLDHDHRWCGEAVYIERRGNGDVWLVGHVDDSVRPEAHVRLGDELRSVETAVYWSATRIGDEHDGVELLSVAITPSPARVCAKPLTFLPGRLDYRGCTRRWKLDSSHAELLERATAAHLERRRSGGPLVVHTDTDGPSHIDETFASRGAQHGRLEHWPPHANSVLSVR
jgi:hypothetical protein